MNIALSDLKSERPLTILNVNYKIIAKVVSKRLKAALKETLNPDQVKYIEDRFCGENISLISDITGADPAFM